jgi:hypothetical protein
LRRTTLAEAQENVKTHIESLSVLRAEANTTLSLLITGAGAALGYGIKILEDAGTPDVIGGLFGTSIYLFTLCGLLLWKCMWADSVMPANCEPNNLYHPDFDLLAIKEVELEQLQGRCDFNRHKTETIGSWLNLIRAFIFLTPLIFLAVWELA